MCWRRVRRRRTSPGITVTWDSTRPPGQRVVEVELPGKRKLRDGDTYRFAVNDFLATGGSGYTMLVGKPQEPESMGDIEVLELYLKRLAQPVRAPTSTTFVQKGRVTAIRVFVNEQPVDVASPATVADAVTAFDRRAGRAPRRRRGTRATDARGIDIAAR